MNENKKDKLGIDINNLDLTPVIEDKDNESNAKKEVKLFPDIVENEKENLTNNESLTVVEKSNLFPSIGIDVSYNSNNIEDNNAELIDEEILNYKENKNVISILLFIAALLQFFVVPFILRTTNTSEGESIAYPYPNVKYLLCIGFVLFSCFIYYNYRDKVKNKNLKKIIFKVILLLFLIVLFIFNYAIAIVFLLIYILIFIIANVLNKKEEKLAFYVVALFVTGFFAMIGGAVFWFLYLPPLVFFIPIFIVSAILMNFSILCNILFVITCAYSIYLVIKSDSDS